MRYLLAFIFPPLAVLLCGKPGRAILNMVLCLCLWIPGIIHALLIVAEHKADKRSEKQAKIIGRMRNGE